MCAPQPCCVGILPNCSGSAPGVVRSLHPPAWRLTAKGRLRIWKESWTPTPLHSRRLLRPAAGSPRQSAAAGVTARNTFIHSVEEVLNVPNRLTDRPLQLTVVDEAGAQHTVYALPLQRAAARISRRVSSSWSRHIWTAAQLEHKIWRCKVYPVRRRGLFRVTRHVLAQNPEAFVCGSLSSRRSLAGNFVMQCRAACSCPAFTLHFFFFFQQKRIRYSRGVQCLISRKVLIK